MSVPVPAPVSRPEPPSTGDERSMLTVWLDYQRATLLWKCEGLDGTELARRGVPPSGLSLLGIVRHMHFVEWSWFEKVFAATSTPQPFPTDVDRDSDFNDLHPLEAAADFERFAQQCDVSRSIVAGAPSLDALAVSATQGPTTLRWIMIHMIEE